MRILIIDGGTRRKDSCPGEDSKSKIVVKEMQKVSRKGLVFDTVDLSVKGDGDIVQPCKGCVGTAGGFHCHWPCSCYGPGSGSEELQDIMYDQKVYDKLEKCDGFIIVTPLHWYNVSSQVKAFFDRLVCCNLTVTKEKIKKMLGKDNIKNPKFTKPLEESGEFEDLEKNHLEGKVAAFFMWGNNGGIDYKEHKVPKSFMGKRDEGYTNKPVEAAQPYLWQCRYSGIYAPDDLVIADHYGENDSYSEGTEETKKNQQYLNNAKLLVIKLIDEIERLK